MPPQAGLFFLPYLFTVGLHVIPWETLKPAKKHLLDHKQS